MNLEFSRHIFEKYWSIKFHENPSSGSRVVPCGQTDRRTYGQTERRIDLTKLLVASRNFANAPKKECEFIDYSKSKYVYLCVGVKG